MKRKEAASAKFHRKFMKMFNLLFCDTIPTLSGFRAFWDIAMMVALLWIMITLPYRVAFEVELSPSHGAYWFERFIDLFFIAARQHSQHLSGSSRCPDSHVHFPPLSCRTLR